MSWIFLAVSVAGGDQIRLPLQHQEYRGSAGLKLALLAWPELDSGSALRMSCSAAINALLLEAAVSRVVRVPTSPEASVAILEDITA